MGRKDRRERIAPTLNIFSVMGKMVLHHGGKSAAEQRMSEDITGGHRDGI
jgi:hypothetical protein